MARRSVSLHKKTAFVLVFVENKIDFMQLIGNSVISSDDGRNG